MLQFFLTLYIPISDLLLLSFWVHPRHRSNILLTHNLAPSKSLASSILQSAPSLYYYIDHKLHYEEISQCLPLSHPLHTEAELIQPPSSLPDEAILHR